MQILSTPNITPKRHVNFCGKEEILSNLGKAINQSQYAAHAKSCPHNSAAHKEIGKYVNETNRYIYEAIEDGFFKRFISNPGAFLKLQTEIFLGRSQVNSTLPEIVNSTSHFDKDSLKIRAMAYQIFKNEFLHIFEHGFENVPNRKINDFFEILRPTPSRDDLSQNSAEKIEEFYKILNQEKFNYLS